MCIGESSFVSSASYFELGEAESAWTSNWEVLPLALNLERPIGHSESAGTSDWEVLPFALITTGTASQTSLFEGPFRHFGSV